MKKGTVPFAAAVEAALGRQLPGWPEARLCIALSGGVDSVALLQACHALAAIHRRLELRAVHVHHGLQPAADDWARHCELLCERLAVPLEVIRLALTPRVGESVEAEAREARYAALAARLQPGEVLLTAHHQDDQFETLLLQLFRGAGVAGLAAMPAAMSLGAGLHLRPLLELSRAAIEDYARQSGLEWVDDPMNGAARFDRAFLRQQLTPVLRARWPAVARTVARSAGHLAEAQGLLAALAAIEGATLVDGDCLRVEPLCALPRPRQANLLRWWLGQRGLAMPSSARLGAILDDLLPAGVNAQPLVSWRGGELRRYRGRLYAMQPLASLPAEWQRPVRPDEAIDLPGGLGQVALQRTAGPGLSDAAVAGPLLIRFRRGGDSLRPLGEARARSLSGLLQARAVPPWRRSRLPVLVSRGRVLAAGEDWLEAGAVDPAGGWRLYLNR